ncbi:CLUMA_CG007328, isoform A [Clunio marinus]|uniref:CLUMA_CG007328, isoform A n=1 Tax=Clunio marinus TaxID=568069 RepID=A0A1J1I0D7_9DIPT|nr:CLUMA_CG007328, isoform A [Clunio marinus]
MEKIVALKKDETSPERWKFQFNGDLCLWFKHVGRHLMNLVILVRRVNLAPKVRRKTLFPTRAK